MKSVGFFIIDVSIENLIISVDISHQDEEKIYIIIFLLTHFNLLENAKQIRKSQYLHDEIYSTGTLVEI